MYKMRWAGVLMSGVLGGIGGMAYIVPAVGEWNFEMGVAGMGFLALAVMIFGQWKPLNIAGAALFFVDATNSISDYVKQAASWGQKAIAITDHSTLQAFPEAHSAGVKNNVKILYGVEANVVDDSQPIAYNEQHVDLKEATYVVFDTETTGLSARYDKVIELAAVKMQGGTVDRKSVV